MQQFYDNTFSIKQLGFDVKTGPFVWNQHKELLTDDSSQTTIIWAHNIQDNIFTISNDLIVLLNNSSKFFCLLD
jgi:hypothetical protein